MRTSAMPYAHWRVAAAVVAAGAFVSACSNLDRPERIEDTRVLAVRTSPAEILFSPLYLTSAAQRPPIPLPSIDVDVEVFAFDPRGGQTLVSVSMCPENASDSSCRLFDPEAEVSGEPQAAQSDVRDVLRPRIFSATVDEAVYPVGRVTPTTFRYSFTPNVIDYFIEDDADGKPIPAFLPLLPRFVVEVKNLDAKDGEVQKERAFKRIPLALDLTSADLPPDVIAELARAIGFELCPTDVDPFADGVFEEGKADCLGRRLPNNNPAFLGFVFDDKEKLKEGYLFDEAVDISPQSLIAADAGAEITITPVYASGSVERYQILSFDIEASKFALKNREEDLNHDWYTTRGSTSFTQTATQFQDALGVTWTLPTDAKTGERDSLYLVMLDQRGGTAFGHITVEYR